VLKKYDIWLVVDEVICGFGRTGNWWGSQTFGIKPDILTTAKALSSAYVPISAVLVGRLFGASLSTQLSLAPKSVTTPIAMGIAERIGGIPSLTAVLVIITGILGAVGARYVFDAMKLRDPAIRGFAIGVASHGIGTARAFQVNEQSGAFAALAMGLNGALTAILVPLLASWLNAV
jgi:putative effector of murein hydrolase